MNVFSLLKNTNAYRIFQREINGGTLSHAYLLVCDDESMLSNYLNVFAMALMCKEEEPCGKCRDCKLILQGSHTDVMTYPKGKKIIVSDVDDLVQKSFFKPLEGDKKIFLLNGVCSMTVQAQNKLLKTLEEPPENSIIIIGATSEYPLLPTVKSRVLRLELGAFNSEEIFDVLKEECTDVEKLKTAIACGDGTVGTAYSLYGDRSLLEITDFTCDMMINMQTSKDVLDFTTKFNGLKVGIGEFLNVFELALRDKLVTLENKEELVANARVNDRLKEASGFNRGAITYIFDVIREAEKRLKHNANQKMLIEWILFSVLEGKHKWR